MNDTLLDPKKEPSPRKVWWHSKTIIYNVLSFVSMLLTPLVLHEDFTVETLKRLVIINAVVNAILRTITEKPLAVRKE